MIEMMLLLVKPILDLGALALGWHLFRGHGRHWGTSLHRQRSRLRHRRHLGQRPTRGRLLLGDPNAGRARPPRSGVLAGDVRPHIPSRTVVEANRVRLRCRSHEPRGRLLHAWRRRPRVATQGPRRLAWPRLRWLLGPRQMTTLKLKFVGGQIFAMSGGTPEHARLIAEVAFALRGLVDPNACRVFGSDLKVRVEATGLATYPDLTVVCGDLIVDKEDPNAVTNPKIVVEVLSPSTEAYDRGEKWAHYRRIPRCRPLCSSRRSRRASRSTSANPTASSFIAPLRQGNRSPWRLCPPRSRSTRSTRMLSEEDRRASFTPISCCRHGRKPTTNYKSMTFAAIPGAYLWGHADGPLCRLLRSLVAPRELRPAPLAPRDHVPALP